MNKILIGLVSAVLAVIAQPESIAQEYAATPITISKEKVKVNGKVCYSHIVREKQTLFSIAKAYNVTIEDIRMFNPSVVTEGLKKNSIILIPSHDALQTKSDTEEKVSEETIVRKDTVTTTVRNDEKKQSQLKSEKSKKEKQRVHIRKWYEDLDVIAEKYGVSVETIMKANNLSGRKLENRQKLIIPNSDYIGTASSEITSGDNEVIAEDTTRFKEADTTSYIFTHEPEKEFSHKNNINMTVILPMKASTENISRNNIDFYSGILLAARDIAENGIDIELNVYDSADQSTPVSKEDLENSDVIIGPISTGDLSRLLKEVPVTTPVISPLDQRAEHLTYIHQNFIQAPTPHKIQYNDLIEWMKEDKSEGDKILVISEKGENPTEAVRQMNEALNSSGIGYIPFTYSILEGRDVIEPLKGLMTEEGINRVFIASESEAFVNDVVRNLNILVYMKMNVVLYAPSKIRSFETIEVENLHNTSLHVCLTYNIDYEQKEVKDFLLKYRALFNTEPTQYAFQGYDTAMFIADLCKTYGNEWFQQMDKSERNMLQNTFRYIRTDAGYLNTGTRRIVYGNNWEVKRIR